MCASFFEDSGWDDLEGGSNIQSNRAPLIVQSHDFVTERPAHLALQLTLRQVTGMRPFFQLYSTLALTLYTFMVLAFCFVAFCRVKLGFSKFTEMSV